MKWSFVIGFWVRSVEVSNVRHPDVIKYQNQVEVQDEVQPDQVEVSEVQVQQ